MSDDVHPLYTGGAADAAPITVIDDTGEDPLKHPIRFKIQNSEMPDGKLRDQGNDAAEHMRYAATLKLPELIQAPRPRLGRAIIVGGAPSVKDHLEEIRALAADKSNAVFAINWTHTWLIQNGIIPRGCVFFEIDAEPDTVLKAAHPSVTYFICSHCHQRSFDALEGHKRVLWHSPPNSDGEKVVGEELFKGSTLVGGGISTFTRTMTIALYLGYRHLDVFGCDSSYPEEGKTHVDGYETVMDSKVDGLFVWAKSNRTGQVKRFKTLGYLALQVEEFKVYCEANHQYFSMRVYGDSLLRWAHEEAFPEQYI
jgi:hypothetical protein